MRNDVLNVLIDAMTMEEAAEAADRLMLGRRGGYIVTANSEILLMAQKDAAYREVLGGADLVFPDGIGVIYAGRILRTRFPERVTGADLTPLLLKRLSEREGKVFLYGAKPGVAAEAGRRLSAQYPGLRVVGTENGYITDESGLLERLDTEQPDLILVGLGAPKQEFWMARNRDRSNAVMIGIGGLLDVFAGNVRRAPALWCRLGLEWLYRTIREPRRIARVWKLPRILVLAVYQRLRNKSAAWRKHLGV